MFRKFNKSEFPNALNKTKSFLGNAYHQTKSFMGTVDHGVRTAKKIYAILEPAITHLTGNTAHTGVMKALNGYEDIRHKMISGHDEIENHVKNVSTKFKKAGLSIGI